MISVSADSSNLCNIRTSQAISVYFSPVYIILLLHLPTLFIFFYYLPSVSSITFTGCILTYQRLYIKRVSFISSSNFKFSLLSTLVSFDWCPTRIFTQLSLIELEENKWFQNHYQNALSLNHLSRFPFLLQKSGTYNTDALSTDISGAARILATKCSRSNL